MIIVWFYMFLMAKEFFIKEWLTKRILIYALSHVVIMIFITLIIVNATQYIILGEAENIFKFGALQWYRHNIDSFDIFYGKIFEKGFIRKNCGDCVGTLDYFFKYEYGASSVFCI